jgi:demethylmenaquinone methyltransferase / 2-methoxy-6-polyprenyl-1,4-benzoquinol methylase
MDVGWRRRTIQELALPPGSRILDLACGTGDFCRHLERGGHRPVGIDLSFGMLAAARTDAPLVHGDLLNLPVRDAAADGAVCGFALRNLVELPAFLSELARTVRPGGRIALLEVSTPDNPVMRWGHGVYFGRVVPALGGLLSERSAYQYLPRSMAYLPPSDKLLDLIGTAGFGDVRRVQLSGGIAQLFLGTRTGPGGAQPNGSDRGASSPQL